MSSPPNPLLLTPAYVSVVGSGNAVPDTSATSSSSTDHHSSSSWRNLSPSILIIVIVLSVTVIVSVALCLLLRHLNRRCLRHVSSLSSSSSAISITSVPILSSNRISPETPPSSVIHSLPSFTFSSAIARRSSSSISGDCAVCLSKFEKDDRLRLLPLCCHAFHADCIDVWLSSNLTCPLCRSSIFTSDADGLMKVLRSPSNSGNSFRLEIGNVSRRGTVAETQSSGGGDSVGRSRSRSYSIGSFEYFVEDDSEITLSNAHRTSVSESKEEETMEASEANLATEVGGGRSWIKEYVDRFSASLSSRAMSFRSSGRFFSGSSRRSEVSGVAELDLESNRAGEEISEMFRWFSVV